ncbi:MAG: chain length-determining protein [Nitrospirota bacterium]|nr:chain length-determining protein [Nitrospirota bacterium]
MEESTVEFQKYLKMIIKRRRLFIVLSLCIMTVIVWGSYLLPKKYEASSTIFVESNVIKELVKGIAITPEMGDRVKIVGYTLMSRGLVAETLKALDIDAQKKTTADFEKAITDFQSRTNIELKLKENIFMVSLQDENPRIARDYINTLVSKYVEMNVAAKKEEAFGASTFLDEQVAQAKANLDRVEQEIIEYRKLKGVYIAKDETSILGEIRTYNGQIEQIRMRRNELAALKASLGKQLKGEEPMIPVFTSGRTGSVEGRGPMTAKDRQIAQLEERLKQLLVRFTDNYPEVVKLKTEIEVLKRQKKSATDSGDTDDASSEESLSTVNPTYQQLKDKYLAAESELSALDANQSHLAGLIRQREADLRSLPTEKKRLIELENDRNAQKTVYDQLKIRLEQSQISKQMEVSDKSTTFRIVDPAVLSQKPVSPNRIMLILMGIVVGLGGGFGIIFLMDFFRSSFKDVQSVKDLGLPVLAVIPRMVDQVVLLQEAKKDKVLYAAAAGCFLVLVCVPLVLELLGVTIIDSVFNRLLRG